MTFGEISQNLPNFAKGSRVNYKGDPVNYRGHKGALRREPTAAVRSPLSLLSLSCKLTVRPCNLYANLWRNFAKISKFCQRFAYQLQGRPCKLQGAQGGPKERTHGGRTDSLEDIVACIRSLETECMPLSNGATRVGFRSDFLPG